MTLDLLAGDYAICRLNADAALPTSVASAAFWSVTRTADELSLVCEAGDAPAGSAAERGYRGLKVRGPLSFSQVGVIASLSSVLAAASLSIFVVSTYDTDYLFVRGVDLDRAIEALRQAGHTVAIDA